MLNNLFRIFLKSHRIKAILRIIQEIDNQEKCSQVVLKNEAKLYPESKIFNIQGNPKSILINGNTHVKGELLVFGYGGKIEIGMNCYIGEGTRIWSSNFVHIGNDVLVSHNCNIIDTDSHELNYEERASSFKNLIEKGHSKTKLNVKDAPIIIEDNAWISYNVSIMKGVKIGKGSIIGAGSVVTKDVPEFTLWAGNPAKQIKSLR